MYDPAAESDLEASTVAGPQTNDEVSMSDLDTIGDLSTLANDMSVAAPPVAWARNNRDGAIETPRKSNRKAVVKSVDDDSSTDETAPETPPDKLVIKVKQPKSSTAKNSYGDESEADSSIESDYSYDDVRIKRIFCLATVLGFVLLGSIGALAIALVRIRQTGSDGGSDTTSLRGDLPPTTSAPISLENLFPPTIPPTIPPAASPVSSPVASPTGAPPTASPDTLSTPVPTNAPVEPVEGPVVAQQRTSLLALLDTVSPEPIEMLDDDNSPQAKATEWLAADPSFSTYSPEKLVQRWVLVVLFESLEGGFVERRRLQGNILTDWKTYSDECQWFSTRPEDFCNRSGLVRSIDIRDASLSGTLPKELHLLSNSLVNINLPGNQLQGTLPSELARLTRLDRLQLTGNDIGGSIPPELFSVVTLNLVGLGRNDLSGTIPEEIGNLLEMTTFGIESNNIGGTIPSSIQSCQALRFVSVNNNMLTGSIPPELGSLTGLELLLVHNNNLQGEVPEPVCDLATNFLLEDFYTDCAVECSCCEECNGVPTTPSPTISSEPSSPPMPSSAPTTDEPSSTPTATVTEAPSMMPTIQPIVPTTPQPTRCENFIEVDGCVDELTQFITVNFANCEPEEDDWVAIYPADRNPQDLGDPILWAWTCGDQSCRGEEREGTVIFQREFFDFNGPYEWPLSRREDYIVHILRRNRGGPYSSFADANLNVRRSCN